MTHDIYASAGAPVLAILFGLLILRGIVGLLRWHDRRFAQQLDADFRAHVMVEEAKRQAARGRCTLYTQAPDGRIDTVITAPVDGWRDGDGAAEERSHA